MDRDRLSALPDGVICHILSFLPTKISVSTSVLSTRWRSQWAHVPCLDFDDEDHNSNTSFSSIINRVMLRRKSPSIDTFRLINNSFDCSEYDIETWVTTAVDRNVRYLDLDFQPYTIFMLPRCLYTCKTLVGLSLGFCAFPHFSVPVSLPSLAKLHLYSIEYAVDETLPMLLSGCPLLKELIIERILNHDLGCLDISSPTLKWLKVSFPFDGSEFGYPGYRVKINAPALRYLEVNDYSYELISISAKNSLVEANIWLNNYMMEVDYSVYTRCVLKFLDSLSNVKCLYLFGWFEKNLDLAVAGSSVKFNNLTKLELAADWRFLTKFLESADHLEVLIIHELKSDLKCWMEPQQVPKCLLSCLRTVRVDQFECYEHEFGLIRYILRNGKVLERMEVFSEREETEWEANVDALMRISSFQRGSVACELVFH